MASADVLFQARLGEIFKGNKMSRSCDLTGKAVQVGNNVSHSQRKTRRRFLPNLNTITFTSEVLSKTFKLKVAAATLRSIDKNGGFDSYVLSRSEKELTEFGQKVRRQLRKKAAA